MKKIIILISVIVALHVVITNFVLSYDDYIFIPGDSISGKYIHWYDTVSIRIDIDSLSKKEKIQSLDISLKHIGAGTLDSLKLYFINQYNDSTISYESKIINDTIMQPYMIQPITAPMSTRLTGLTESFSFKKEIPHNVKKIYMGTIKNDSIDTVKVNIFPNWK